MRLVSSARPCGPAHPRARASFFLCACAILGPLAAVAPERAWAQAVPPAEIERVALAFARGAAHPPGQRLEVSLASPIAAITRTCADPLSASLPSGERLWRRANVSVRCTRPSAWSVNVNLAVRAFAEVPTTARALGRGETLTAADVVLRDWDLTELPDDVLFGTDVSGKVTRIPIAAGVALRRHLLRAPFLVTRGQSVVLRAGGADFSISTEAKALGDAAMGEDLNVRTAAGKTLRTRVVSPGVVEAR